MREIERQTLEQDHSARDATLKPRSPSLSLSVSLSFFHFLSASHLRDSLAGKIRKRARKIRRISRTVRRIDSGFRGRCYEMDPCTARRERESKRARWNERVRGSGTGLQREVLSVAKLPSTSFTSSRQPSPPRASQPRSLPTTTLCFPAPVITSTNIQAITFRDRTRKERGGGGEREREKEDSHAVNSMESTG